MEDYGDSAAVTEQDEAVAVLELSKKDAAALEKEDGVLYVEKDIIFEGSDYEDDDFNEMFGTDFEDESEMQMFLRELRSLEAQSVDAKEQWNIDAVNANAQEYNQAEDRIKVAVLDTGVTLTEDIDVAGRINLIPGEEELSPLYEDVAGHGTAVASVIAAKENNMGVTGINPNVELYSAKVLDNNKQASLSRVIEGIHWCMEQNVDIINMSFGTSVQSDILAEVVKDAKAQGILMIAAAGNGGSTSGSNVEYPAAYPEVIAVGATDTQGSFSDISSVGEKLELLAPGETVPATGYFDEIICTEGTSMSAPHVTGIASVLWARDSGRSADFIRALLNASANPVTDDNKTGSGIVDLDYALEIYDSFAESYTEGEEADIPAVQENPNEVKSYSDAQVEACWSISEKDTGINRHTEPLDSVTSTTASALMYIKAGATLPDKFLIQDLTQDAEHTNCCFHGSRNYIAAYKYMRKMAKICYDEGWAAALAYGNANTTMFSDEYTRIGLAQMMNGLNYLDSLSKTWDWKYILSTPFEDT